MTYYETYLAHRLVENGYPAEDLTIYECSGFSQGDGVAWYGKLGEDDLKKLRVRYFQEAGGHGNETTAYRRVLARFDKAKLETMFSTYHGVDDLKVEITQRGHHYHHWNTMCVDIDGDSTYPEDFWENYQDGAVLDGTTERDWMHMTKALGRFIEWLQEDVKRVSKVIDSELQSIKLAEFVEDETLWTFETKRFRFEFEAFNDEDLTQCCGPDAGLWEETRLIEFLTDLAQDKGKVFNFRATVFDRETEEELASTDAGYWFESHEQVKRSCRDSRRSLVSELIAEVRRLEQSASQSQPIAA